MSECLQPSNLGEFIDLSEQAELSDSIISNNKSPIVDAILKNSKHPQLKEAKHEENTKEIKEDCRIEKILAEDMQWLNQANTVHQGQLKSYKTFNDKYEGEIKCGLPHGHGLYTFDDGISYYNGDFEFGKYNGYGILHSPSGNHYIGSWCENFRSNYGKEIFANGDIYEGNWKHDKFHGYGVYEYKDGSYYHGDWGKGKKNGHGVFKWADGAAYSGTWSYNEKEKGVIYYQNGCKLEGKFEWDFLRKPKFFDANGTCINGIPEDIYNKYLEDIDWHFKNSHIQKKEKKRIEIEEEIKSFETAEEKKTIGMPEEKHNIKNDKENSTITLWHGLFKCFGKKNKKLD